MFLSPFYNPFYDPWWFPYQGGYTRSGNGRAYDDLSSLRVQVSPRETEVFVDGYYAGTVDDFDGMFQRLHLEPGEHDVTLYLAGHRTVNQKIFLQHDGTFRIRHTMERLAAGEANEPRPAAPPRSARGPRGPVVPARNTSPGQDDVVHGHDLHFFVFDPQVNALAKVLPHLAVNFAGGYRLTGLTNALSGRLNGPSWNVALQFEW